MMTEMKKVGVPAVNIAEAIRLTGLTEEEGQAALKELEDAGMIRNAGTTRAEDY